MAPTNVSQLPAVFFTSGHLGQCAQDPGRRVRHYVLGAISIAVAALLITPQLNAAFAEPHSMATVSLSAGVRPRIDFSLEDECIVIKANTCWTLSGKTNAGDIVTMRGKGSRKLELEEAMSEVTVCCE